jgi:hypothetical protein
MFAIGVIGTAYADDKIITGGAGTCNADVLGTAENGATANTIATWSLNEYDCPAGQYLMVDGENIACTPCASGSYCPGGIFTVESEEKGTYQCPTDYASSVGGSDSQNDCYQGCSATCTQQPVPLHAINVIHGNETASGKHYYGGSCDATSTICSLSFQCDTGYHKRPDLTDEQLVQLLINLNGGSAEDYTPEMLEEIKSETFDNWEVLESEMQDTPDFKMILSEIDKIQHPERINVFLQPFRVLAQTFIDENVEDLPSDGYMYKKDGFGTEYCIRGNYIRSVSLFWTNLIGEKIDCDIAAQQSPELAAFRQSAQNGDWFVISPQWGISASGKSKCDNSYEYDKCRGTITNINGVPLLKEVWDSASDMNFEDNMDYCNTTCVSEATIDGFSIPMIYTVIKYGLKDYGHDLTNTLKDAFKEKGYDVFFNSHGAYITYMCDANKIGIDWNPDDGSENISGMCLYGGDVNVPDYIPTKPGYTFKGWKLIK